MNFSALICAIILSLLSYSNLIVCRVIARYDDSYNHFTNVILSEDKKHIFVGSTENKLFGLSSQYGLFQTNVFVLDSHSFRTTCFTNVSKCTNESVNCSSINHDNSNYLIPVLTTINHVLICGSSLEGACIFANYSLKQDKYLCEFLQPNFTSYISSNYFLAERQTKEKVWIVADVSKLKVLQSRHYGNFSTKENYLEVPSSLNVYRYFLAFQKYDFVYHVASRNVTKNILNRDFILRSCIENLNKSVEIPIKFASSRVDYAEIFDSTSSEYLIFLLVRQSNSSVLFTINFQNMENHIERVVKDCFSKGHGFNTPSHLKSDKCKAMDSMPTDDYCGQNQLHHQIFSQDAIVANLSHKFKCSYVSRIVYDNVSDTLFASCDDGSILKLQVNLNQNVTLKVFDTIAESLSNDNSSSFGQFLDMKLGHEDDLIVLTNHSVLKFSRYNCSSHSSCDRCSTNPQCGWCVPRGRCTVKGDCTSKKSLPKEYIWLQECINIISILPDKSPIELLKIKKFRLTVDFIPDPNSTICQASSPETLSPQKVDAKVSMGKDGLFHVECSPFNDIPSDIVNRDVSSSTLYVSVVAHGYTLNETSVPLIMCSNIKNCEACFVSSDNLCLWCPKTHRCVDSMYVDTCHRDTFYKLDKATCPHTEPEVLTAMMPVDHATNFTMKVYYLTRYQIERQLYCKVGTMLSPPALVHKANNSSDVWDVTCTLETMKGQILENNESFDLDLVWGKDKNVIKSSKIMNALVYDCGEIGKTCGSCLLLDKKFDCVLCEDRFCTHASSCSGPFKKGATDICTNPIISSFYPAGAPLHSKVTKVTVQGSNLPFTLQDINISIAGLSCKIDPDLSHFFVRGEQIMCRLASSYDERKGQVMLTSRYNAKSKQDFVFKDPELSGMHPLRGPRSGKTLVTIAGKNLHFGSHVVVEVNKHAGEVVSRNETTISILTPPCQTPSVGLIGLDVKIDGVLLKNGMGVMQFTYMDDPVVTIIDPNLALKSGGNIVGIRGANLKNVQHPKFIVYIGGENRTSECRRDGSSTYMECPTPVLTGLKVKLPLRLECGLVMDGVHGLLRLGWDNSKTILYNSDPILDDLGQPVVYSKKNNKLVLSGTDLQVLQSFTDLVISMNNASCDGHFINSTNIICDIPDLTRVPLDNGKATVTVSLGNFKRVVGEIDYGTKKTSLIIIIIIACAVIGLVVLSVVAVVVLLKLYRRRNVNASFQNNFLLKHAASSRSSSSPLRPLNSDTSRSSLPVKATPSIKDDVTYFEEALQRIESAKLKNVARNVFVPRNKIQLENPIGRGSFTRVHMANMTMRNQFGYENDAKVCVKVIEDSNMSDRTLDAFIRETAIMNNFKHDNVLGILAVCLGHRKEPWVVLPFMSNGDLRSYIKDKAKTFTARQLLHMAQQVAGGMAYLSSLDFVHRELCARNCLLDDTLMVKVSDFGLTTELHEREFFSPSPLKFDRLPIKWMAIESIENFVFTSKSDVWSFGVLVWELMTRGVVPYPDVQSQQIRFLITSGRRLKKPKYCPPVVYNMMMDCWQEIPERRPTFTDLVNRLELLLNPPRKKDSQSEQLDEGEPLYINTTDPQSPGYTRVKRL